MITSGTLRLVIPVAIMLIRPVVTERIGAEGHVMTLAVPVRVQLLSQHQPRHRQHHILLNIRQHHLVSNHRRRLPYHQVLLYLHRHHHHHYRLFIRRYIRLCSPRNLRLFNQAINPVCFRRRLQAISQVGCRLLNQVDFPHPFRAMVHRCSPRWNPV